MGKQKRVNPWLRQVAKEARRRYGQRVKLRTLPGARYGTTLFIDWVHPDGTVYDTLTVSPGDRSAVYTREITLRVGADSTSESVLDDVEAIRTSTVRGYWKQQQQKRETE